MAHRGSGGAVAHGARALLALQSPIEILRFLRARARVRDRTLLGLARLATLYRLGRLIERRRVPGDVVECGVYRGGSAALLGRATAPHRRLWLFDSFAGLPPPTAPDGPVPRAAYHDGWCASDVATVRNALARLGVSEDRFVVVPGFFADTFPTVTVPRVALLHIDADWYESVRLCLERFYDAVVPGGAIVIDDYGHWPGCRRAVDEFFAARGLPVSLECADYTGRWLWKV